MRKSDIIDFLSQTLSAERAKKMAEEAYENKASLEYLVKIFCEDNYRLIQRISWVLSLLAEKDASKLSPYENELFKAVSAPKTPDAIKRNVMRIWAISGVSHDLEGGAYDLAIKFITGKEAIAIKAHSLTVALTIAQKFKELQEELLIVTEDLLQKEGSSAGIRSKCNRVIKELRSQT